MNEALRTVLIIVCFIVSLFLPGLGNIIQKRWKSGILIFLIFICLITLAPSLFPLLGLVAAIYSIPYFEKYDSCHRQILSDEDREILKQKRITEKAERTLIRENKKKAKILEKIEAKVLEAKKYYENVHSKMIKHSNDDSSILWTGNPILISFDYIKYEAEEKETRVLGLYQIEANKWGDLLFVGYCLLRKKERTFKIDRIESNINDGFVEMEVNAWIHERFNHVDNKLILKNI